MSNGAQRPPVLEATPPRVAALLRARTKDNEGREIGLWTEATRPTVGQVVELIEYARNLLAGTLGPPGERCANGYEQLVVIQAAMLVELSYWPEQVRTDRSPYQHLAELYDRTLTGYEACIAGEFDPEWRPARVYSVKTPSLPLDSDRFPTPTPPFLADADLMADQVANYNDPNAD